MAALKLNNVEICIDVLAVALGSLFTKIILEKFLPAPWWMRLRTV